MSVEKEGNPLNESGFQLILDSVKSAIYQRKAICGETLGLLYLMQKSKTGSEEIESLKQYFSEQGLLEDSQELNNVLNALKCQSIYKGEDGLYHHEYIAGIPVVASPISKNYDIDFKSHKLIYANFIQEALSEKIKNKNKDTSIKKVKIDVLNSLITPRSCKRAIYASDRQDFVKDISSFEMPDSLILEKGKLSTFILPIRISMAFETAQEASLDYGDRFNETFFDIDFMKAVESVVVEQSDSYMPKRDFDIGCGMPFIISELVESYNAFRKKEKMIIGLQPHFAITAPETYIVEIQVCKEDHFVQINFFQEDVLHHEFIYGQMDIYDHTNEPRDLIVIEDTLRRMGLEPKLFEVDEIDSKCKTFFRPQLSLVI